jgi:transposase InsO family protein
MPWKEIKPMDQKIQLIADWKTTNFNKTDLSRKYGVSRKTVYKWIDRYKENSVDGLKEQSRAPQNSPNRTSEEKVRLIIEEKLKNRKRGPKKIYRQLKNKYSDIKWPSPSTIGNWLKKKGLVEKRKRRLFVPPYTEPFMECQSPNAVWSVDYKGQLYTKDSRVCYPLTMSDNYSRYLLECQGLPGPRYEETRKVFEEVFSEYGLPEAIRSDNGIPFTGRCAGGLSRLSIWWIRLGIIPERIDKGCPQQNGRHERMHRTLKEETMYPVSRNMKEQQERFDLFRVDYNHNRPHEALNQNTPSSCYKKSARPYVEDPVVPDYDLGYAVRKVKHSGEIKFKGQMYFLTALLTGQPVGLREIADGLWRIYYSFYAIATLDLRTNKIVR